MSDLQFSFRHQQSIPAAVQSSIINATINNKPPIATQILTTTTTTTATTTCTTNTTAAPKSHQRPSTSQLSLNLFNKLSFEDRDEFHILPATITEECAQITQQQDQQQQQQQCPQKNNINNETDEQLSEIQKNVILGDNINEKTFNNFNSETKDEKNDNLVKQSSSDCDQLITTQQQQQFQHIGPSVIATFNTGDATTTIELISTTCGSVPPLTSISISSTYGTTPTINVVCPIDEEIPSTPSPIIGSEQVASITTTTTTTSSAQPTPTTTNIDEEILPIIILPPQIPPPPPSPSSSITLVEQINLDVQTFDEKYIPQEELSPTTDEYQECCAPDDDYQYDITAAVGEMLTVGCVAPAPTPAPSIAPLAEVEIDPDDIDISEATAAAAIAAAAMIPTTIEAVEKNAAAATAANNSSDTIEHKKKRKKKNSFEKMDKDVVTTTDIVATTTTTASTVTTSDDAQNRNAVCPWEDE